MSGANRILDVMASLGAGAAAQSASGLSYGTVTEVSPLTIVRDGERAPITEGFLVLSVLCRPVPNLWGGLSVGEKVVLLSFDSNQKFFVERLSL